MRTQFQVIEFDPATSVSTAAQFEIVPNAEFSGKLGQIYFTLHIKGFELNHIQVDAFVDSVAERRLSSYAKPKVAFVPLPNEPGAPPDLVISITPDGNSGQIAVSLQPNLDALRDEFDRDQLLRPSPRHPWNKFTLSFQASQRNELTQRAVDAYRRLRQMVSPDPEQHKRLSQLYKIQNLPVFRATFPSDPLNLINSHRDLALLSFMEVGKDLYRALFTEYFGAPPDLALAVQRVEAFRLADRPLKISIETPYFLPLQLLYPVFDDASPGTVDPLKFWGFKYELSVRQTVRGQRNRLNSSPRVLRRQDVLFARGKNVSSSDRLDEFADEVLNALRAWFGTPSDSPLIVAESGNAFTKSLLKEADSLQLVFLYSHATSGSEVILSSNTLHTVQDDIGPRIIFAENELVRPRALERLYDGLKRSPVFAKQPIFILNACETGTGGTEPANSGLFVATLMQLGANAVVVTESEIWAQFAKEWAKTLIAELGKGHDLPRAVRNARWKHLTENKNPMGLIYSVYGSPTARINLK